MSEQQEHRLCLLLARVYHGEMLTPAEFSEVHFLLHTHDGQEIADIAEYVTIH